MYKARISVVLLWWVICVISSLCFGAGEAISDKYPENYPSKARGVCDSVEAKTTDACKGEFYQRSPIWSPDGKKFAFLKTITQKLHTIMIYKTEDDKISSLLPVSRPSPAADPIIKEIETKHDKGDDEPTIMDFAWGPDSRHFAFLRISKKRDENGIFIGKLEKNNIDKLETKDDMKLNRVVWSNEADAEGNSFIAFTSGGACFIQKIKKINNGYKYERDGRPLKILSYPSPSEHIISYPAFSPDGKELVVSIGDKDKFKLFRINVAKSWRNKEECEPERLTEDVGGVSDICPVYSPEGRYIAFYSTRETTSPNKYTLWVLDLKEKGFRRAKRVLEDYISRSDISFMCASWLDEYTLLYKKDAPGELYPIYKVEIKEIKGKMEFTKPEILPPFGDREHKGLQKNTTIIDFSVSHRSKAIAFSHQIIERGFRMAWIALKEPPEKPKELLPSDKKEVVISKSTEDTKKIKEPPPPEKSKESAVLPDKKKPVTPESGIGGIKNIYLSSAVVAKEFRNILSIGSGADEIKETYKEKKTYSLSEALSFFGKPPERIEYEKCISEKGWEVLVFKMTGDKGGIILERHLVGVLLNLKEDKVKGKERSCVTEKGTLESPRGREELLKAICDKSGFKENSTIHFLVRRDLRLSMTGISSVVKPEEIKKGEKEGELLAIVVINGKGKRNIFSMAGEKKKGFLEDNPDMWIIEIDSQ